MRSPVIGSLESLFLHYERSGNKCAIIVSCCNRHMQCHKRPLTLGIAGSAPSRIHCPTLQKRQDAAAHCPKLCSRDKCSATVSVAVFLLSRWPCSRALTRTEHSGQTVWVVRRASCKSLSSSDSSNLDLSWARGTADLGRTAMMSMLSTATPLVLSLCSC